MAEQSKYVLRFFFDWRAGGCLWSGNDAAYRDLGHGPPGEYDPCPLPLSTAVLEQCRQMASWHDTALNWKSPADPGPWRQAECDRFNAAVMELIANIRQELGVEFMVIDHQDRRAEDAELDAYLADPDGFRRRSAREAPVAPTRRRPRRRRLT